VTQSRSLLLSPIAPLSRTVHTSISKHACRASLFLCHFVLCVLSHSRLCATHSSRSQYLLNCFCVRFVLYIAGARRRLCFGFHFLQPHEVGLGQHVSAGTVQFDACVQRALKRRSSRGARHHLLSRLGQRDRTSRFLLGWKHRRSAHPHSTRALPHHHL
jgi:hypothetical protein